MSWREVLGLLEQTGGNIEAILPERMAEATRSGNGSPDIQKKIALYEYRRRYRKEQKNDSQKDSQINRIDNSSSDSLF